MAEKNGFSLFTPISSHVINLFDKISFDFSNLFSCAIKAKSGCAIKAKSGVILELPKSIVIKLSRLGPLITFLVNFYWNKYW